MNKASFIVSCIAPEGTVSKLFCAASFVSTAVETFRIVNGSIAQNEFSRLAAENRKALQNAKMELATLRTKLNAQNMSQVKTNTDKLFFGLCHAVKKDCL